MILSLHYYSYIKNYFLFSSFDCRRRTKLPISVLRRWLTNTKVSSIAQIQFINFSSFIAMLSMLLYFPVFPSFFLLEVVFFGFNYLCTRHIQRSDSSTFCVFFLCSVHVWNFSLYIMCERDYFLCRVLS